MQGHVDPAYKFNMDFTTISVFINKDNEYHFVYDDANETESENKVIQDMQQVCTIKYLLIISATGRASDPLFIIQDKELGDEECVIQEISGLSQGNTVGSKGKICAMKSRSGNEAFFRHLFMEHLPNFINKIRQERNETEGDGTPKRAEVSMDGEALALAGALEDDCRRILLRLKIELKKLCASCSGWQQPCDVGKIFLSIKTFLRHAYPETTTTTVDDLYPGLRTFLDNNTKMKPFGKKGLYSALPVLINALQKSVTTSNVTASFKMSGVYPLSLEQMYKQSTAQVTEEQKEIINGCITELAEVYLRKGTITDHDMTSRGILLNGDDKGDDHSNRALQHQRIVWLTHDNTLERIEDAREVKARKEAERRAEAAAKVEQQVTAAINLTRDFNTQVGLGWNEDSFFKNKLRPDLRTALEGLYSVMEKVERPKVPVPLRQVQQDIIQFYISDDIKLRAAREKFRLTYRDRYTQE